MDLRILDGVARLHNVGVRIEGLAEPYPLASEAVRTIARDVRSTATILAALVATELHKGEELHFV